MIEDLKQNVETEIEILREISNNLMRLDYANPSERKLLLTSVESLRSSMKVINSSIPKLLDEISVVRKLPQDAKPIGMERVEFKRAGTTILVTIDSKDREKLIRELSMSESRIRKLKKRQLLPEEKFDEMRAARGYLKISNRLFLETSQNLISKGYFQGLSVQLKKANIYVLFAAYVAMIFFTTLLSFLASMFIMLFFLFFNIDFSTFMPVLYTGDILTRLLYVIWVPIVVPVIVFMLMYYYPSTEKSSQAKRIDSELPFAVIYMSAISGSGIEPTEIFKIIGLSNEYPYLRKEMRKLLNQINIYGYDLVTSLNNVSKTTPSTKLAELFSGLATSITSGSSLQSFFEKRADDLLRAYRLEREKYTKVAETFMDIYISIVIAAPMILMILLVMISLTSSQTAFTTVEMTLAVVVVIGLINAVFIGVLQLRQPIY